MNGPSLIFFSLLCLYLYTPESDSLWCYQCASVKEGQDCQSDYKGMNKSALTMEGKYAKDCSKQFVGQDDSTYKCVIETHMKEGGYFLSFRRDCSDGVHFSYNLLTSTPNISHLQNLLPNNQSACAIYGDLVVCLTLCDDDFCNGPRPNQTSNDTCVPKYYYNGTEKVTCGSIGHLYARYPTVFGIVIDGIVGNFLTAPLLLCLLLALVLH
ncbi:uncharacterized protein LOC121390657 isoform X2 [Gigantopelta aegis]|uniref:uncharacterized protein LOC121390657 isoform X2 n=1 Tax=Gigantopelta aegis TaxID=1735272 RepID=UPI001B88CDA3|nr:uncharacterized protein LOC121390657 isoform X2 [Gigantopelta aegis]